MENEHRDYPTRPVPFFFGQPVPVTYVDLCTSEHATWNGMIEKIDSIKKFFNNPDKDAAPLITGDIIATPIAKVLQLFTGKIALHVAIYLGDGRVSHVSGHGGGKAAGVARIGRLLGDFTTKGTETIWLLNLLLRIRSGEEIAKKAEEFAANEFRKGDYNVFLRNCQHFVALCATGGEFAFNI
ncbi:hypothetical protein B9Z55_020935 [Caenorhabditis nigoni]|uniref:LRAT domain-containing protein n=1 Tax=Caenorhabditis nigoni TaxID=1611254 RepID=A0A2G5TPV3_9PELO|nr:hypothetical protein B9Z55_020935 [Caenorhabditis nigoni]